MLDECKGDRLEELLSSFALVVLRSTHQKYDQGNALKGAAASRNTEAQHRLPLILAHRHSLQENLALRQELRRTAVIRREIMDKEHSRLKDRKERISRSPEGASTKEVKAAVDVFRSGIGAESQWLNIAMHGGLSPVAAAAPENAEDASQTGGQAGEGLVLADLEHFLQRHNEELSCWQEIRHSLALSHSVNEPSSVPKTNSHPPILFDKHQTLEPVLDTRSAAPFLCREHEILPAYQEILHQMESELRPIRSTHAKTEAENANVLQACRNESAWRGSETRVDLGDANGCSSAEVTTPLASPPENRLSPSNVQGIATRVRFGPDESHFSWLNESSERQASANLPNVEADSNSYDAETQNKFYRPSSRGQLQQDVQTEFGTLPATEHRRHRLSTLQTSHLELPREPDTMPVSEGPPSSLLERTRQSMSLAATAAEQKAARKKATGNRFFQFPVAQSKTPERAGYREPPLSAISNDSTPREQLLSDDADYSSVFKTRPKIALSPVISPEHTLNMDSILEQRMEDLEMNDDKV